MRPQNCTPPRGTFQTHLSPWWLPSTASPRTPPPTHVTQSQHSLAEITNKHRTQRDQEIDHPKKIVSLSGRRRRCLHCPRRCHHFISWAANDTAGAVGQTQVSGVVVVVSGAAPRCWGGSYRTSQDFAVTLSSYIVKNLNILVWMNNFLLDVVF